MTARKPQKPKNKKESNLKVKKISKKKGEWEKVKIKGKVISDDGGGFEGLIGLEVLENYEPFKAKISKSKKAKVEKKDGKKELKDGKKELKNGKKEAKDGKQSAKSDTKKSKNKDKKKKLKAFTPNKAYPNERFALLRPPKESDDADVVPELVPSTVELEGWNGLGIPQPILRALAENGFKSPTEIQALTLPAAILGKKDILGAAETGSGKTLAFGIPILAGIMELKSKNVASGIRKVSKKPEVVNPPEVKRAKVQEDRELTPPPEELAYFPLPVDDDEDSDNEKPIKKKQKNRPLYAVVLTPTRELAVQIRNHLIAVAKYTGIKVAVIFGGLSVEKQERVLRQCPEIVVATPGRFWELYDQENPHLTKTEDISFLVIDETDRMVEKGHFEELRSLLKVLNADEDKKKIRQNFVFSATLTLVHDLPDHLQKRNFGKYPKFVKQTPGLKVQNLIEELGISQPKIVDITRSQQTAQNLMECRLMCAIDYKDYYLYYFVERHPGRTIVFCNSIDCVKRLSTLFGLLQCNPLPLHASMIQKQRLKNLERFRDNPMGLLIATDVAARGLDIPNVDHVIHYQVPRTSENYVHRSGRTARATKDGITVMLMEPGEVKSYVKLYKTLDRSEDLPLFPVSESYLGAVKERVNLARELDKEELKLKRTQTEIGWMKKTADEMDIIIDGYNDESGSDQDEDPFIIERRRNRMRLEDLRMKLKTLLSQTIFPKGFSFRYPTSNTQLQTTELTMSNSTKEVRAVDVMQKAIEDKKLEKSLRNKKRKHS